VLFTRTHESLIEGLMSYIEEKAIDTSYYTKMVDELFQTPHDLMKITNVVHKLLLEAV